MDEEPSENREPPLLQTNQPAEPPILRRPVQPHRVDEFHHDTRSEFAQWIHDTLGSESYGAPRVFDLFTLLAITLAFAMLFAFMKLIEPLLQTGLPQIALIVSLFLTFTAVAQAVLWGGNKPRLASIAAGPIVWLLTFFFVALQHPSTFLSLQSVLGNFCLSIMGFPIGYLAGGMVAGVFLLADVFRQRFMSGDPGQTPANDDAVFEDDDGD